MLSCHRDNSSLSQLRCFIKLNLLQKRSEIKAIIVHLDLSLQVHQAEYGHLQLQHNLMGWVWLCARGGLSPQQSRRQESQEQQGQGTTYDILVAYCKENINHYS